MAKGLFNRVIFQSDGASYVTAVPQNVARARGVAFAKTANCGEEATPAVAKCLRNVLSRNLNSAAPALLPHVLAGGA